MAAALFGTAGWRPPKGCLFDQQPYLQGYLSIDSLWHSYRHRTSVESVFRDGKLGAALRHLPSGQHVATSVIVRWRRETLILEARLREEAR